MVKDCKYSLAIRAYEKTHENPLRPEYETVTIYLWLVNLTPPDVTPPINKTLLRAY